MKKTIILLALLALLPLVVLSAQEADDAPRRGCLVGTPNKQFTPHRAQRTADSENPYTGSRRQLVVLASFQDCDFAEDHDATLTRWNNIFNAEGYHEAPFTGSIHDYFLAQSYGLFNLSFDLVSVELPGARSKYKSTHFDDENSQYMVDDIVDKLSADGLDWSLYDWDGEATSVSGVPALQARPDRWYTLDGRRPGKKATGKGIYIHQGRKVVTERTE